MNKQERKLKGFYKFKKRLANHSLMNSMTNPESKGNIHAFKTTGKPCSCVMCSPAKTGEVKASVTRKINATEYVDYDDMIIHIDDSFSDSMFRDMLTDDMIH